MSAKKWQVVLTEADRSALVALTKRGRADARQIRRAHILLQAAEGHSDEAIATTLHTNRSTVERTRRRFVLEGTERALRDRPRPGAPRKLDGKQEALLLALVCSSPPRGAGSLEHAVAGRSAGDRWCGGHDFGRDHAAGPQTGRSQALAQGAVVYPEGRAEFVWHMEDVLDLYAEPYDPDHPVVCFDERPCQLLADVRPSEPVQPGRPARVDYNYRRNGTYNVFTAFQPLVGWRHVEVTTRRACADFSHAPRPAALNTCGGAPDVLRFSVRKVIE